jgi:hypothetical protein
VAFHSGGFFALALSSWLFVELAGAQVGQETQFLDSALEATQCDVKGFVFFYTNGCHDQGFQIVALAQY